MKDEWACLIIWILFLGAIFLFVLYLQWDSKRDERKEKAEEERIRNCKHRNGFTIVKVFGHPDLRECVDCGSIFEENGEEVDPDYLEDFIANIDRWIETSDGGRELKIYLTREQFRKIYRISMERKMTMDDMIGELIDGLKKRMMERVGIQVKSLCCGNEKIEMLFNGEWIGFYASYIGQEPLASLIQAVYELEQCGVSDMDNDEIRYESEARWLSEPGFLSLEFKRINDTLHIHYKTSNDFECKAILMEELRFCVSFKAFKDAVIRESMRVLREYGFKGYYESWGDHRDFPLATFLSLMGIGSECKDDDSIKSCFEDECRLIMELTKKTK